jgi:hypothetical protein
VAFMASLRSLSLSTGRGPLPLGALSISGLDWTGFLGPAVGWQISMFFFKKYANDILPLFHNVMCLHFSRSKFDHKFNQRDQLRPEQKVFTSLVKFMVKFRSWKV